MSRPKKIPITCDPDGRLRRVPIAQLVPFQGELKSLPKEQHDKLAASMKAEGFMAPVFVWGDKILDGHQRLHVLQAEGWQLEGDGVPVIEIEARDEQDAARKLLKITSAYGRPEPEGVFDFMRLHALLLPDFADVDLPNFDADAFGLMFDDTEPVEPPEPREPPVTPVTQGGDLWLMGEHRVLCGDSTDEAPVARLLDGKSPLLVVTDPPYGIGYQGGVANKKKRERLEGDLTTELYGAALRLAESHMPSGAWYIWFAGSKSEEVAGSITSLGFEIRALVFWNKLKAHYGAPSAHYCQKHEPCFYAVRGSASWSGPSNEVTVWDVEQPHRNEHHPTEKPVECMARPIRNHGSAGDVVYDPFLGSGTTVVASHSEERVCYGMEIASAYVDVSVIRWQEYTGQDATLDGDGRTFAEIRAERMPTAEAAG